jgi:hypothetical protein
MLPTGKLTTVQYLLEHGGSNINDTNNRNESVWDLLQWHLKVGGTLYGPVNDAATVTALLRVMVVRGDPPPELTARLSLDHALVVQEGARLRAKLPAYLARRRSLVDEHCSLIAPLRALVYGYEAPTTTGDLWTTGLGAAP